MTWTKLFRWWVAEAKDFQHFYDYQHPETDPHPTFGHMLLALWRFPKWDPALLRHSDTHFYKGVRMDQAN